LKKRNAGGERFKPCSLEIALHIHDNLTKIFDHMPKDVTRKWFSLFIKLSVSGLCVAIVLRKADIGSIIEILSRFPLKIWLLAFGIFLIVQFLSAARWMILSNAMGMQGRISFYYQFYLIGCFFNMFLPGSVTGDAIKGYMLVKRGFPPSLVTYSVLGDRIFGVIALAIICAVVTPAFNKLMPAGVAESVVMLSALLVVGFTTFVLWHPLAARLLKNVLPFNIENPAFLVFWKTNVFAGALGLSILLQVGNCIVHYLLAGGMGIGVQPWFYFFAVPVVSLFASLPVSIQGIGVREGGFVWIMGLMDVPPEKAVALGLLSYSISLATGFLGGVFYLKSKNSALDSRCKQSQGNHN